jgi:hypothetical protein
MVPSVLLFEKTVFPQALDKPCMDFITWSSLSENMSALHKTSTKEEDKISYCHKCLKSLYYLNKWAFKMNKYSFLSECFDISLINLNIVL